MPDDAGFLEAIRTAPDDAALRLIYADWLEERSDLRADFLRLQLALKSAAPDHPQRACAEQELSYLRNDLNASWLAVIEPESGPCKCFEDIFQPLPKGERRKWLESEFHVEPQDTECAAWKRLLELIEEATTDGRREFAPLRAMSLDERNKIVTLPATVTKLTAVEHLNLYGSQLVRIPPEIGGMTNLKVFTPYTSYRLHWFPYEITRCKNLKDSTVSTRALYGNFKYRPPFPRLKPGGASAGSRAELEDLPLKRWKAELIRNCSVCEQPFEDRRRHRVWISLSVATDVLPLLVNACSEECIQRLPTPPEHYVQQPHRGGLELQQPPPDSFYS